MGILIILYCSSSHKVHDPVAQLSTLNMDNPYVQLLSDGYVTNGFLFGFVLPFDKVNIVY